MKTHRDCQHKDCPHRNCPTGPFLQSVYIFHSRYNCSYFGNGVAKTFKNYNCSQKWTAFIVPFRKREEHLPYFLKAITKHQLNNSQENNYEILIIEQGRHLL